MIPPTAPRSREEHCPVVVIGPCGFKPRLPKNTATSEPVSPQLSVIKVLFFLITLLCSLPWPGVPGLFANEQAIYLEQPDLPAVTISTLKPRRAKTGTY